MIKLIRMVIELIMSLLT